MIPNSNENNRANEFQPVFKKITRQPSVSGHVLAVILQAENTAAKINQLKDRLEKANHLLTNGKNLSSDCRQKLKHTIETFTRQLAKLEEKVEKMTHTQNDGNYLLGKR